MNREEEIKKVKQYLRIFLDPSEVYSIGTHVCGLRHGVEQSEELVNSIFEKGLLFRIPEGVGITGTVYMQGSTDFEEKLDSSIEDLYDKVDNDLIPAGVVVAVPGSLKGEDGKRYFIGTYPDDLDFVAKDDKRLRKIPVEQYVKYNGLVPKEFVLGVVTKIDGETMFFGNSDFISYLDSDKQALFLERMKDYPIDVKTISDSEYYSPLTEYFGEDFVLAQRYLSDSARKYEMDRERQEKKYEDWLKKAELDVMMTSDSFKASSAISK